MFITFEGGEGSGKTTQIQRTQAYLSDKGRDVLLTREPGGTPIGRKIRAILLDPDHTDLDYRAELLLYMADRCHHLHSRVLPALAQGRIVLCDRYVDATLAYQGFGRDLGTDLIQTLHESVLNGFMPDMTLLLDLPPETGLTRARRQIDAGDREKGEMRFEAETLAFHRKVRAGYLELARQFPGRYRIIDAAADPDTVQARIRSHLTELLRWPPGPERL